MDGSKSWDADNDQLSFNWRIIDENRVVCQNDRILSFCNTKEDRIKILLTVSDSSGLTGEDTIVVKIIDDKAPVAHAGVISLLL